MDIGTDGPDKIARLLTFTLETVDITGASILCDTELNDSDDRPTDDKEDTVTSLSVGSEGRKWS